MRRIFSVLFLVFCVYGFSQDSRTFYERTFYDQKEKKNLGNLKVTNKSTGKYDYTDKNGYLIIEAQRNDTLTWNNGKDFTVVYWVYPLRDILENNIYDRDVRSVISKDYQERVNSDTKKEADPYDVQFSPFKIDKKNEAHYPKIKSVSKTSDSTFQIEGLKDRKIFVKGSFSSTTEIQVHNGLPKLQNKYVQGRSIGGNLAWQGPGTNEVFSYGPDISTLGWNGISNNYDINGNLVGLASAIRSASPYSNKLLKPLINTTNNLSLNTFYNVQNVTLVDFYLKLGINKEPRYFEDEFSRGNNFGATLKLSPKKWNVKLDYNFSETQFTNTDRIGYYNRVYQNWLLTPISFDLSQNYLLPNGNQRTFSNQNDNPLFLLNDRNKFNSKFRQNDYGISLSRRFKQRLSLDAVGKFSRQEINHNDYFQPSTAFFLSGINSERKQLLDDISISAGLTYERNDYRSIEHGASMKYIFTKQDNSINYSLLSNNYNYSRLTNEVLLNYNSRIYVEDVILEVDLGGQLYNSSTSTIKNSWLTNGKVVADLRDLLDLDNIFINAGFTNSAEESPLTKSHANYFLTTLLPQQNLSYFPTKEVESYNHLSPVYKSKRYVGFSIKPTWKLTILGEYYKTYIKDDIVPYIESGNLYLKNMFDHHYEGFDIRVNYDKIFRSDQLSFSTSASFYKFTNKIDRVSDGYNYHPIMGFANIYKGLVVGESTGSIIGTSYLRDAQGNIVIDADGFPTKNNDLKVIGNSIPDFVVKINHYLEYRDWSLQINWQWSKGGQIWNGTRAALDYYGMSKESGDLRGVQNYVFQGVNSLGNINTTPVDFYNPNLDVSENRWTRYGIDGIGEAYIEDADYVKINNISISRKFFMNQDRKNAIHLTAYVSNLFLWRKYQGVDPQQNFYNTESGQGLDFFNLPGITGYGFSFSYNF